MAALCPLTCITRKDGIEKCCINFAEEYSFVIYYQLIASMYGKSYHILTDRLPYDEQRHRPSAPPPPSPAHLVQQLQALGYEVTIQPKEAPAA